MEHRIAEPSPSVAPSKDGPQANWRDLREWLALPWETVAFVLERPGAESARQLHVRARRRLAERLERGS